MYENQDSLHFYTIKLPNPRFSILSASVQNLHPIGFFHELSLKLIMALVYKRFAKKCQGILIAYRGRINFSISPGNGCRIPPSGLQSTPSGRGGRFGRALPVTKIPKKGVRAWPGLQNFSPHSRKFAASVPFEITIAQFNVHGYSATKRDPHLCYLVISPFLKIFFKPLDI